MSSETYEKTAIRMSYILEEIIEKLQGGIPLGASCGAFID
jgi:hypothetical protein